MGVALDQVVEVVHRISLALTEMGLVSFHPDQWAASEGAVVEHAVDEFARGSVVLELRQAAVAEAVVWAGGDVAVEGAACVLRVAAWR